MVLLPGCKCCETCYPPANVQSIEIDLLQSAAISCEAVVRFSSGGTTTDIPIYGTAPNVTGTYSLNYSSVSLQMDTWGEFVSPSTSRTQLRLRAWPSFFDNAGAVCNYPFDALIKRDCDINTLSRAYSLKASSNGQTWQCGIYRIAEGGAIEGANPCGTDYTVTYQPRVSFVRPASQSYSFLSNTFPFSAVTSEGSNNRFTFGFDWVIKITAVRMISPTVTVPWFNDGSAPCGAW